ncbi:30S ribosomal protein S17 [Candidatus Sneabacter namystus]|uniref:Small ribosomal subunit protein uS17 n=1 Tax=Candidatus Sneabacter namystus TaxID=2601646 RepID=A0A5C0UHV7_9RICK|nr:30S ribosomal protein S17 [Candidatus Sneabacter namystus]QEK39775.1 30S ribosomal protein S17 [Candidatus Sneabacter namystus]
MPKRILQGSVVSASRDKTVSVLVKRRFTSPLYKKIVSRTKKYHAHDSKNMYKVGDKVKIEENSPISKTKKWVVLY